MKLYLIFWAIMSAAAFAVYAYDKVQAQGGGWRVSEKALLLIALLLGAPGALAAMYLLRHKTRKPKFTITVPAMLIAQAALFFAIVF